MIGKKRLSIGIVGSGTAGLVTALMVRRAFPEVDITVVSSSDIGIIGVGEGSTEHWRTMMDICEIPLEELIVSTMATHKYGIRYENWTTHTPDYFHSVGGVDDIFMFGLYATYMGFIEQKKLLTTQTGSIGLVRDKINRQHLHRSTNQFHFDTFKLNEYFTSLCFKRQVKFVDGIVKSTSVDPENGTLLSVTTDRGDEVSASFWFDASGFNRVLLKEVGSPKWNSYSDYLLCNTAIAFPTEADPNGRIRPYTRARASSSGWMWEIPTQERRGNGYVFSKEFSTVEQAVAEAEKMTGYNIPNPRVINFDAGYIQDPWEKNVCAVGLCSSFVEPLEATSIGSTIQMVKLIIPYLAAYEPGYKHSQKFYNDNFRKIMENILTMIRMHYYSDREDTPFWRAMAHMPINPGLQEVIDLWSERPPCRGDFEHAEGQLFLSAHFAHVAQGQGLINIDASTRALDLFDMREAVERKMYDYRHDRHNHEMVDHAEALRELHTLDIEWSK